MYLGRSHPSRFSVDLVLVVKIYIFSSASSHMLHISLSAMDDAIIRGASLLRSHSESFLFKIQNGVKKSQTRFRWICQLQLRSYTRSKVMEC